jgi:hypothetical protein
MYTIKPWASSAWAALAWRWRSAVGLFAQRQNEADEIRFL